MTNWFNHLYPYGNLHELNLDWILNTIKRLVETMDNFINLNTIKYADPILWDITRQYEANTVVVDGRTGNAFISTRAVPSGVQLSRTEYWTQIYNYADELDKLREQIAHDEGESTTATRPYSIDNLVFCNGELYRVIAPMIAGDSFVINSNVVKTTVETEIDRMREVIDAEADARADADTQLQDNIDAEADARADADTQLQEDIEADYNGKIGNLTNLETANKNNVVSAVNEVYGIATQGGQSLANLNLYNVKSYGAIGDGVTNDTNAIKTALNLAVNNHGILYFPNGTYLCHENLNLLNKADFTIMGSSKNAILRFVGDIEGLSFYHSDNVLVTNMTIENTINSTYNVIDFAARNGIIENCVINGYGTKATIKLRNHDNKIINSKIYSAKSSAIECNVLNGDDGINWTINNLIDGCTIISGKYGIIMTKDGAAHLMEGLTISNCVILGEGGTALYGIWAMSIFALTISNCVIDQWKQNGVYLIQSVDTVANVRVDNCYVMGEDYSINLSASNAQPELSSITIDNNTIYSPNGKGIYVDKTYGVNISDNDFNTPQGAITCTSKSKYTRVTNNVIKAQNELATCNQPTVAIFENNFVTNQSINGSYTLDNPTYTFDESGHMTVTHTANWQVQNTNNVIMA